LCFAQDSEGDVAEAVMGTRTSSVLRLAALLSVFGCGESGAPPPTPTGTVAANLTDAPISLDSVSRVDVYVVSLDATMRNATDDDIKNTGSPTSQNPRTGWVTIANPLHSYNLMELRNGVSAPLGVDDIPIGSYRRFRLVIDTDQSTVTLRDGKVLKTTSNPGIRWPSAGRSGVKVDMTGTFNLTQSGATLLVDFNLEDSFVLAGPTISNGGLIFNPVLRAEKK